MFPFLSQKIKIKNLKITLFVFSSLFVLSFAVFSFADTQSTTDKNIFQDTDQDGLSNDEEKLYGTNPNEADTDGDSYTDGTEIKSGYNPLKAAPGDRVSSLADLEEQEQNISRETVSVAKKVNLTEEVSRQVAMTMKESVSNKEDLSLDELRETVQKTMADNITTDALPEIDTKDIKIKKQKYDSLSEADRAEKIKEDTLEYTTALSYIFINNSPVSIQSDSDAENFASSMLGSSVTMLTGGNPAMLEEITKKGVMITEQLQNVTVPEHMLELHIKALRLAQYAMTFKDGIQSAGSADPLAQINTLAKVQGFISLFSGFASDMNAVLVKYDVQVPVASS
ncbi:MAG: hypothetical protein PHT88_03030 [Candidatus Moranbacteria bacterium]|nr:hypothetical protein [Candidatus Moranbacteria bacterium]